MTSDIRALDHTVRILGTKFEMQIIRVLLQAPCSFEKLTAVGSAHSTPELTVCLAQLEQRGVIERPASIYRLTPIGESLQPIFHAIEKQTRHP